MLLQRVLTALVLAPMVIAMIIWANAPVFALFVGIAFLIGLWEWTRLAGLTRVEPEADGRGSWDRALRIWELLVTAVLMGLAWWFRGLAVWEWITVLGVLWWLVACLWLRHFTYGAAPTTEHRSLKMLVGKLVVVPAWASLMLIHGSRPDGPWWTLLLLLTVWAADIGAYFAGRRFGRRKLAPQISPGKTWAGAYGAVVAAGVVMGLGGWALGLHDGRLAALVLLAVVVTGIGIVGDLFESLMKRQARVKDSGTLFPGHGGMLDRMDSMFAAAPVFALGLWLLNLIAPA